MQLSHMNKTIQNIVLESLGQLELTSGDRNSQLLNNISRAVALQVVNDFEQSRKQGENLINRDEKTDQ